MIQPEYVAASPTRIYEVADKLATDEWLVVSTAGENIEGKEVRKTVAIPMGEGKDGREKIRNAGVTLAQLGNELTVANVKFGSRAKKLGVEQGSKIVELKVPNPQRPSPHWVFIPAAIIAWLVWFLQGRRIGRKLLPA
jgi:hypothetical protein